MHPEAITTIKNNPIIPKVSFFKNNPPYDYIKMFLVFMKEGSFNHNLKEQTLVKWEIVEGRINTPLFLIVSFTVL